MDLFDGTDTAAPADTPPSPPVAPDDAAAMLAIGWTMYHSAILAAILGAAAFLIGYPVLFVLDVLGTPITAPATAGSLYLLVLAVGWATFLLAELANRAYLAYRGREWL